MSAVLIDEVVSVLLDDEVAIVPTDTVYGLAIRASSPAAVAEVFRLKRRPEGVALAVLVGSVEEAVALGEFSPMAMEVISAWPGALTVVVKCDSNLGELVGSSDSSVGLRVPDSTVISRLCQKVGPLVVTSANKHGEPTPEDFDSVSAIFPDLVGLDGGRCVGAASTVVDVRGVTPEILRPGPVTL